MGFAATCLREVGREVGQYASKADETEQVIIQHSCIAGAAGLVPIPGVDTVICLGNQIALYGRLNAILGVSLAKNTLKVIGGFMASQVTGMLSVFGFALAGKVAGGLLKCIPGLGTIGGVAVDCAINAGVTYVLGVVYVKAMVRIFKAGKPVTEESLKEALRTEFADEEGLKDIYREGREKMKHTNFASYKDEAEKYKDGL